MIADGRKPSILAPLTRLPVLTVFDAAGAKAISLKTDKHQQNSNLKMNQKLLFLAGGILAGAAAVYFIPEANRGPVEVAAVAPAKVPEKALPAPPSLPHVEQEIAPTPATPTAAPVVTSAWARLTEKYGAEKTALSSKITSDITSVINRGIDLANTAARNSGSDSIAEAAGKEVLRNASGELGLTDEQQKRAGAVIQSVVEKRMAAVTDLTSAMSSEPEQMMGMLLAGDSLARNEITQTEYDGLTLPTRTMLQNLATFVGGQAGSGGVGQLFGDPQTAAQLNAILTPDQQAKLAEMTAKAAQDMQARLATQANSGLPFETGQIPVMELKKLDQSVASVKQMADAAKLMMDAMKGLKEASAKP